MEAVSMEEFARMHDAFRAKLDYDKAVAAYKEKALLSRLMTARPVDPVKGFSVGDLKSLVKFSFESSHQSLNFSEIGWDGKRYDASTSLQAEEDGTIRLESTVKDERHDYSRTESFEADKKDGFVPEYVHDKDDVNKDEKNRRYASELSESGRLVGNPYDNYYMELDKVRYSRPLRMIAAAVKLDSTVKSYSEIARRVSDKKERSSREFRSMREQVAETAGEVKVSSSGDVVKARMEMLKCIGIHAESLDCKAMEKVERYEAFSKALSKADALAIYEQQRLQVPEPEKVPSLDKLMAFSRKESNLCYFNTRHDERFRHFDTLMKFTVNALNAGYAREVIEGKRSEYCRKHGLHSGFAPAYDVVVQFVAGSYVEALMEQTDTAFGKGVRDSAKIDVLTPFGNLTQRFSDVKDMAAAAAFLEEKGEAVTVGSTVELGAGVYAARGGVKPEAVARVAGVAVQEVISGYTAALGEDFISQMSDSVSFYGADTLGVTTLSTDMYETAKLLSVNGPESVGSFLREAGVTLAKGNGLKANFLNAARLMYQDGSLLCASRTAEFRSRWSEYINTARMQSRRQVAMKVRKNLGCRY